MDRKEEEILNLSRSFRVERMENRFDQFCVYYPGPVGSPYEGGLWRILVTFPERYLRKNLTLQFLNKIYHPNIDLESGQLCHTLTAAYQCSRYSSLTTLFQGVLDCVFCMIDPVTRKGRILNQEAAEMWMSNPDIFEERVREYLQIYANPPVDDAGDVGGSSSHDISGGAGNGE